MAIERLLYEREMSDTMDYEGRLLTQQECYQIGYAKGREAGLQEAVALCREFVGVDALHCAAAIERLLKP